MEQTVDQVPAEGSPDMKHPRKRLFLIPLLLLAVVTAAYLGLCVYAGARDTFFPNVFINGAEVSGLTAEEARERLCTELPARTLTLTDSQSGENLLTLPLSELGYTADCFMPLADTYLARQAEGSFFLRGWNFLVSLTGRTLTVQDWPEPAEAAFAAAAGRLAQQLSRPPVHAAYALESAGIAITCPRDGRALTASDLEILRQSDLWQETFQVPLTFEILPAETLTAQQVADALCGEMRNAGYDPATDTITPERTGVSFDIAAAQKAMDAAVPGETIQFPAAIQPPTVTAEALRTLLFRDVLGECRTAVSGTAARKTNVRLATAAINGTVLAAGQVFSFNQTVGQRTAARGYQSAPAYVQGETVDEIGGGICQASSTLYLACLRANLEITERYAHRYTPSYIDWGMDATVSWGGPDYKFTNNTDYPVKISAVYENGTLTVRLLGTNLTGTTAKITAEKVSTTPWKTVYEEDASLRPGTEQVKTTPYTGHTVKTYRSLYSADGTWLSTAYEATSSYKARDRVVLRGPEKVPLPAAGTEPLPADPVVPEPPSAPVIGEAQLPDTPAEPAEPSGDAAAFLPDPLPQ